ncbi:PASTA domain-containing protein [Paenarthrobacter sp. NPDC092416]|uniref:PASTA domain-containing protein n=1 Tax=Paenarthrobacter sp. NPDC092416 TaxID=3364386 RepID=UPI0037F9A223
MTSITLTLSSPTVELKDGKGSLTASASNTGTQPLRVVLGAFPVGESGGPTYAGIQNPLRTIGPGATEQYLVSFDTTGAAVGSYQVKLIAYSADDAPEDYADQAHIVTLVVTATPVPVTPPARPFPWLWVIIGAVVLVAVAATLWFLLRPGGVPNVEGRPEAEARQVLLDAGYAIASTNVQSDSAPGTVVRQDPRGGSQTDKGSIVTIEISAPDTVTVPNVVGLQQQEATQRLERAGLTVSINIVSSSAPAGTVLVQNPAEGTQVPPGTNVNIHIAAIIGLVVP